jgi:phosphoribosylanthranilate isomerase
MMRAVDAREAERLGADYVGVILTTSPRQVTVSQALDVFEAAPSPKRVGVASAGDPLSIAKSARELELDVIQLHGSVIPDELSRLREEFDGYVWALAAVDHTTGEVDSSWRSVSDLVDALLLDTSVKGKTGGTGTPFDWRAAQAVVQRMSRETRIVVAGGLTPLNVAEAIRILHPSVADVSSGVESAPGKKDHQLMQAFANAVRSASIV